MKKSSDKKIAVIGSGIIGLSIAWQCQRNGHRVQLFDKGLPDQSTSWVAAGMLAPASELLPEKEEVYQERKASLELYPRFLEELRSDSGHAPRIDRCGSLWVELKGQDPAVLDHKVSLWQELGVDFHTVSREQASRATGVPTERIRRAYRVPEEAHINNRTLLKDLLQAFLLQGGEFHEGTLIERVRKEGGGWILESSGKSFQAGELILCAGTGSRSIDGIPEEDRRIRPLKGVILQLRGEPRPGEILRSPGCYLLAKGPRTLLLGASMEEAGDDTVHAGTVLRLLQEGERLFPRIHGHAWHRADIGHRPAFPDHEPRVERAKENGMIRAEGHFRHGILGAPRTAYRVLELLEDPP